MIVRRVPIEIDLEPRDASTGGVGPEGDRAGSRQHGHVRRLQGGRRDADLGIALGERPGTGTRRTSCTGCRCHPRAGRCPSGSGNGRETLPFEAVGDVGDDRLVRDGRVRERRRTRPFDGIGAGGAVDTEQSLGFGVVGLELVVVDRPGRRDAVLALERRRSPRAGSAAAPRRRPWCTRRRSGRWTDGTACRSRPGRDPSCGIASRRRSPAGSSSRARVAGSRRARR